MAVILMTVLYETVCKHEIGVAVHIQLHRTFIYFLPREIYGD